MRCWVWARLRTSHGFLAGLSRREARQREPCPEATLVDALHDKIKPKQFVKHPNLGNNFIFSSTKRSSQRSTTLGWQTRVRTLSPRSRRLPGAGSGYEGNWRRANSPASAGPGPGRAPRRPLETRTRASPSGSSGTEAGHY